MKRKIAEIGSENCTECKDRKMTRKEAFRKSGYLAFTAATMLILLSNPKKAHSASVAPPPIW